jgi:hypothetical protein
MKQGMQEPAGARLETRACPHLPYVGTIPLRSVYQAGAGVPDFFMFGDPHNNYYRGSVYYDDISWKAGKSTDWGFMVGHDGAPKSRRGFLLRDFFGGKFLCFCRGFGENGW